MTSIVRPSEAVVGRARLLATLLATPVGVAYALSGSADADPGRTLFGFAMVSVVGGLWGIPLDGSPNAERVEPAIELVPHAVWRINLDAQLDRMTLADPTIDYDLVECWTPAPKRKSSHDAVREYRREVIRRSIAGTTFATDNDYTERIDVNTWGQAKPVRTLVVRREPAIVIDTDEMVAATSAAEFAGAVARAAEDAMPGTPAAVRRARLRERGIIA